MSIEDNVGTVKAFFAAMGGGDKQALLALSAEDIEWIVPGRRPSRHPIIAPETGNQAPNLGLLIAKLDLGTAHKITPGKLGGGMHRTDSIDLVVLISGEGELAYPGE